MIFNEDLNFAEKTNSNNSLSSYPVAFGITFTPMLTGIIIGILGLLGFGYIILNMLIPEFEKYNQLKTKIIQIEQEHDQKNQQAQRINLTRKRLALSQQQKSQVLSLMGDEKNLNNLLLSINQIIEFTNSHSLGNPYIKAKLKKFTPLGEKPQLVTDNSLGESLKNQLKRQIIHVEIEGNFYQIQTIMASLEKLPLLLLIDKYKCQLLAPTIDPKRIVSTGKILTSFELVIPISLTDKEASEIAAKTPLQ
ncbi:pilus assembly protein PilO [Cylindrospermopsis curvispora]|uniref:Pilus assembly protein PilO n=1 Tax=Cylindrospermopsis curvispora GIHE-G1 TaxID=2666332 RepID=A0A7H0EXB7_9CYAN|nr:pilus assembly protein PilO [Cylindrospermopsis curvispora]QNP28433.1 pilus assembly protein PilO [Cylindrospermopsis curvispora GIHE-G1]